MSSNKHLKRHIKRTSDQVYEMQVGRKKAAAIYGDTTGRRQRCIAAINLVMCLYVLAVINT